MDIFIKIKMDLDMKITIRKEEVLLNYRKIKRFSYKIKI